VGVAGILASPVAGRVADRRGPQGVITLAIGVVAVSFVLFMAWPTIAGLILGVILVDLGAQASMISNQSIIYGLAAEARGRINTVFMTGMFLGGAVGSAGAGVAWAVGGGGLGGWRAVCAFCLVLALGAGLVQMRKARAEHPLPVRL
jgi:MFS family permease